MKKFFSLLFAIYGAITVVCAQSQIATLNHNGEITTFYGADALRNAYSDAENGDIINLSAGTFNARSINKLITIRGAGMGVKIDENSPYSDPTILVGDFWVDVSSDTIHYVTMEGICHKNTMNFNNNCPAQFIKCSFYKIVSHATKSDPIFIHCYVTESYTQADGKFSAIASYFKIGSLKGGTNSLYSFTNCILETTYNPWSTISKTSLKNCILINTRTGNTDKTDQSNIYYSLWVGPGQENPFMNAATPEHHNSVFPADGQLFEDNTFYRLTQQGKSYLGSDNTEIGIYGGSIPFDPTPSNPQITKFQVAPKTTIDGKLSVDIEVGQPN